MSTPNLRTLVGTPATKIGTFLFEFTTPGIGQILKAAGADYAVLDMEHTGFGFDTVRGDQVEVVNLQFAERPDAVPAGTAEAGLFDFTRDDLAVGLRGETYWENGLDLGAESLPLPDPVEALESLDPIAP